MYLIVCFAGWHIYNFNSLAWLWNMELIPKIRLTDDVVSLCSKIRTIFCFYFGTRDQGKIKFSSLDNVW